jgi:DNA transformation protein
MSSKKTTVDYIVEQIQSAGTISSRKMFGEYAIYCNQKVVALVCDDQLFVKPTEAGKEFLVDYHEGSPYPGAKPYLLISGEMWDDSEWLTHLFRITALALPPPPPKKKKPPRV